MGSSGIEWCSVFGFAYWHLWKWRNDLIFSQKRTPRTQKAGIVYSSDSASIMAFQNPAKFGERTGQRVQDLIHWKAHPVGFVSLNTDGAFRRSISEATAGGVLRDDRGMWLGGFSMRLGYCSSFRAELWGLYKGLQFTWDEGYQRVFAQLDSKSVVDLLASNSHSSIHNTNLVSRIRTFLSYDWKVNIIHVYKEEIYARGFHG